MTIIRANPLIAAVLGGLVVMALLVFLLNDGPDSAPAIPAADPTPVGGDPVATPAGSTPTYVGPNVRTLMCDTLLPFEAVRTALRNPDSWDQTARAEDCYINSPSTSATIQIAPGHPNDFLPGATIFGVTGTPVDGVGDLALWFGGPTAEGNGAIGAIVVAADTELGALVFRIAVGRPDLSPDAQREVARTLALAALPRFPGVAAAGAAADPTPLPAQPIEADPAPPALSDRARESYLQNLLAREAAGEWTRGDGLVATLRLFAGELDPAEVFPNDVSQRDPAPGSGPVLDASGTSIVRLAAAYLESAEADPDNSAEIERLLDLLYPPPPPGSETAATASTADSPRTARGTRAIARDVARRIDRGIDQGIDHDASRSTAQGIDQGITHSSAQQPDCYAPFPQYDEICFTNAPLDDALFGDKYTLWAPDLPTQVVWAGWVIGDTTLTDAVTKTAITLEGLTGGMPAVEAWLTPNKVTVFRYRPGHCRVYFGTELQDFAGVDPGLAQQVIAAELARCFIWESVTAGDVRQTEWWEDGLAFYLSDVVFPDGSWELYRGWPAELARWEFSLTLPERLLINMPFFEYLDTRLGLQGTVDAAAQISAIGLESVSDIDDHWHEYVKALTAGVIFDQGATGIHAYDPPSARIELTEPVSLVAELPAFGQQRAHLTVPNGRYACVAYEDEGSLDMLVSWRSAAPPAAGGDWSTDLPAVISGEATFVITNSQPDSRLYLDVHELRENPNCGDDDDPPPVPIPDPPCGGCPGTSFYSNWKIPGFD